MKMLYTPKIRAREVLSALSVLAIALSGISCTTSSVVKGRAVLSPSYVVTFVDSDGSDLGIPSRIAGRGTKVVRPKDPSKTFAFTKPGLYIGKPQYTFGAWHYDDCTPWEFTKHVVVKNITLIASWIGPSPIEGVKPNNLDSAFAYIKTNTARYPEYTLVFDADAAGGTQVFDAKSAKLNIIGIRGVRTLTYTGGGTGTLFSIRKNAGTFTIGNNIILRDLVAMQTIQAGTFQMGSPEKPVEPGRRKDEKQHQVRLSSFYMGKYEVTQELWRLVMGKSLDHSEFQTEGLERRPVDSVHFYSALVFCNRLSMLEGLEPVYSIAGSTNPMAWGVYERNPPAWNRVVWRPEANGYRLPTEAEWEYACRADKGKETAFNCGTATPAAAAGYAAIVKPLGWYNDGKIKTTQEVGQKLPNGWGLYDMHGNVYEWCWDWYESEYTIGETQVDPKGPPEPWYDLRRVLRGGAYNKPASSLRSAFRDHGKMDHVCSEDGLRVARSML